jgi:hypothetical protein
MRFLALVLGGIVFIRGLAAVVSGARDGIVSRKIFSEASLRQISGAAARRYGWFGVIGGSLFMLMGILIAIFGWN